MFSGYTPDMLLLALLLTLPAAAGPDPQKTETTTILLVDTVLSNSLSDLDPKIVRAFLDLDLETVPPALREKAGAKQLEIRSLLKLHDTKKQGVIVQPLEGCVLESFVRPFKDQSIYELAGYVPIAEDEEKFVMDLTHCQEVDLSCKFTLIIFHDRGSKKPRKLDLYMKDPLMNLVAEKRSKGGHNQTPFFGSGLFCPEK